MCQIWKICCFKVIILLLVSLSVPANAAFNVFSVENQNTPFTKRQMLLTDSAISAGQTKEQLAILYFQYYRVDLLKPLLEEFNPSAISGSSLIQFLHGFVHYYSGRYTEASTFFNEAMKLARQIEAGKASQKWLDTIAIYNSVNNVFLGKYAVAIDELAKIRNSAQEKGWKTLAAKTDYMLGIASYEHKDYETALKHYTRAENSYPEGNTLLIADAKMARAQMVNIVGERAHAFRTLDSANQVFENLEDKSSLAFGYLLKSYFYSKDERPKESLGWIAKSVKLREQIGTKIEVANAYVHYSARLQENGFADRAIEFAKKAVSILEASDDITGQWDAYANLAILLYTSGNFKNAYEYMRKAERKLLEKARLDVTTEVARLNSQFGLEQEKLKNQNLDDKNAMLEAQLKLKAQEQKQQKLVLYGLAALLVISVAAVTIIYKLYTKNKRLATRDTLTGLHNRRRILEIGAQNFTISQRYSQPLSVLMLDIDLFKNINDKYGHKEGDRVLEFVGKICRNTLRGSDYVGRIGGEEFLFVLPNTREFDSKCLAERLCKDIREASSAAKLQIEKVTVSVGVAQYTKAYKTFSDLVNMADIALYKAKHGGRDRVVLFDNNMYEEFSTDRPVVDVVVS